MSLITYIGIDPGATGGIAILCGSAVQVMTMPHSEQSIYDILRSHASPPGRVCAAIEQVSGFIGEAHPGSAMFTFGQNYGFLRACLIACGLTPNKGDPATGTFLSLPPQRWQHDIIVPTVVGRITPKFKGEPKTEWKNRLKWNAQQLFPKKRYPRLTITLRTADALLIAAYTKQQFTSYLKRRGC
jgi:hypothetical protein